MKYFFLLISIAAIALVALAGYPGHKFRKPPVEVFPDMDRQAKVGEQQRSAFFADGVASRLPVVGTVPMGFEVPEVAASSAGATPEAYAFTHGDDFYNTGRFGDYFGDGFPEEVDVDEVLLARGKDRFDIYCVICHGASGNGVGVLSKYGIANIANFHLPQFADPANPDYRSNGSIYHTIAHGKGLMAPYGSNLTVRDRWAVVAYLRALQTSWKMEHSQIAEEFDAAQADPDSGSEAKETGGTETPAS